MSLVLYRWKRAGRVVELRRGVYALADPYRSAPLFFGYRVQRIMDADVRIAEPEKALVDLWYLGAGEWNVERRASMRFDPEMLWSGERLREIVQLTESPRLHRALLAWERYAEEEGDVEEISE